MTDGRGRDPIDRDGDADGERKMDAPGSGPQRVVSERGVDDILEALDDGPGNGGSDETASDANGGDDDGPNADRRDDPRDDESTPSPSTAEPLLADPSSSDRRSATSDSETPLEEADADPDGGAELSYRDNEALAGRVAANEVTGADVRAAESGSDREATPAIDDVDLSMDDLEDASTGGAAATESASDSGTDQSPSDAAGLGTVDDPSSADEPADEDESNDDSADGESGLLRRLLPWRR